ncbi:MAG: ATP-binding cassette domain-containing protein [Solirubrobacterales bacterium]
MPEPAIAAEGLTKVFAGSGSGIGRRSAETVAVSDVSFEVDAGAAFAIVGESGSGKTTVARCLAGLETLTSGTIEVCGERLTGRGSSRAERLRRARMIQLVFQDPYQSLDPRQQVGSALAEAISVHQPKGEATEKAVVSLLERVGLSAKILDSYPRVLSGGQRQRVAIARALAAGPEVIVFDESVSALDVSIQAQVLNLIADLRESAGVTTIFISHDLAVVGQVSEAMIVMRRGEVVEAGPTAEILASPSHPYTQRLIASVPRVGWDPEQLLAP